MKHKLFILAAALMTAGVCTTLKAQNEADILRLSQQTVQGSARYSGLGGAMGSLGGDFSAITINPAGIGIYRFSEVSLTPAVESNTIDAFQTDQQTSESITRFVINNAGLVLANEVSHPHWESVNFGFSYQRFNTFNDELAIASNNDVNNSFMQTFVDEANGYYPDELSEFGALLAWEGYVIDTLDTATEYIGAIREGKMRQYHRATRKGNTSDFSLSLGANYRNFLYLGVGMGIQTLKYDLEVNTLENPESQTASDLEEYSFQEQLATEGIGVNFKLGVILKLGKVIRVGGAIHTPTTFSLTDTYQNKLNSRLVNPVEQFNLESSIGVFEYRIQTPWRYMASISGVFKKRALLTAQYEFANHASGELKNARNTGSEDVDFSNINDLVSTEFTGQHIMRGGVEIRATENWYLRYGMAYFTNIIPANEFTDANLDRVQYSGGIGYKAASWNLDLSYQLTRYDELYYTHGGAELTTLSSNFQSFAMTLGIRI